MIFEFNQLNEAFLRSLSDDRNEEQLLQKQADLAKEYIEVSTEKQLQYITEAREADLRFDSHIVIAADEELNDYFNKQMQTEVIVLNSDTFNNLNTLKQDSLAGISDENISDFIDRQRVRLSDAVSRYDALREESKLLSEKLDKIALEGGDYIAIRNEIYAADKALDISYSEILDTREELDKASETLRERMFNRGEFLHESLHPVADNYKEHLIEYDKAKAEIQRNLEKANNVVSSSNTDLGRLYQRLTQSEKHLEQLENRWDALLIEEDLIKSEINKLHLELKHEEIKFSPEDLQRSEQITRRGNSAQEELKTYYRIRAFDNYSVGSSASYGHSQNLTNIESRELAFARRQEMMLSESRELLSSDPLKAERAELLRKFEYHEYKAAVSNKIANTPGVGTQRDRDNVIYHDYESGKFAIRLAEIDYKLAKDAATENTSVQVPERLGALASNVRKGEAIKERYQEQLNEREIAQALKQFNQVIIDSTTRIAQIKEDLADLSKRSEKLETEKMMLEQQKDDVIEKIAELSSQDKFGLQKKQLSLAPELGVQTKVVLNRDVNYAAIRQANEGLQLNLSDKQLQNIDTSKAELQRIREAREQLKEKSNVEQYQKAM